MTDITYDTSSFIVSGPSVVQAFAAVMAEVQAVGKDGTNTSQNYNFRGIDGVVNAVGPALRKHGVVILPRLTKANYRDVEVGRNRTLMREVTVEVEYVIHGPAGDEIVGGPVPGESMDSGDKGTAKAMSVAYRTFLLQALTIPTHQPDPDTESYERSEAPVPGFRSSLVAAKEKLSESERAVLRQWLQENGLPASPAQMNAEQAEMVCEFILHGLPKIEPEGVASEGGDPARLPGTPSGSPSEGDA